VEVDTPPFCRVVAMTVQPIVASDMLLDDFFLNAISLRGPPLA